MSLHNINQCKGKCAHCSFKAVEPVYNAKFVHGKWAPFCSQRCMYAWVNSQTAEMFWCVKCEEWFTRRCPDHYDDSYLRGV